ncbi:MAG: gamma-glutamyltransferase [Rhodospirillales bacterium]|nr:gamma-glutamyltransferase [Rhodospirillales bacterium]
MNLHRSRVKLGSLLGIRIWTVIAVAGSLAACQHLKPQIKAEPVNIPTYTPSVAPPYAPRIAAAAEKYMVVAANPLASQAGLEMLRAGGHAIDAAIAAQMVLNVVEPQSSGIGGGGFLLHFKKNSGAIEAYDGREWAPGSARPDMFLNFDGSSRKFSEVVPGGLSVGVPGLLRMLEAAHKEHGKLAWQKLFEPAIKVATEGFRISPRLHAMIKRDKHLKKFAKTRAYFYTADGQAKPVGTKLVNKELADTFSLIQLIGVDAFYSGGIAQDIAKTVSASHINPGGMTVKDLESYRAIKREAVCSFYRKWFVCGMPPPSSGGIAVQQILGILQGTDIAKMKPGSVAAVHLIAEASRLAFADRNRYVADPGFVSVPVNRLIDPGYLSKRAKLISPYKSMGRAAPGEVQSQSAGLNITPQTEKGNSTTHLSVVDALGNAVALTSSIESAFGSRLMVRGFLLNNQMTDFTFKPFHGDTLTVNSARAGKRPRSSMSPTLIVDGTGKLVLAVGSPGGPRIIGYVAQTIISALDWNMDIQAAIDAPHIINRNGATELESSRNWSSLKSQLEALGHTVKESVMTSGLHAIRITGGRITGGADQRREGVALGD